MSNITKVEYSGLAEVAAKINADNAELMRIYTSEIVPILVQTSENFKVEGLDYTAVAETMKNLFQGLSVQVQGLSNHLTNVVIPMYENGAMDLATLWQNAGLSDYYSGIGEY